MANPLVNVVAGLASITGTKAVQVSSPGMCGGGGYIINPIDPAHQGLPKTESLFVSIHNAPTSPNADGDTVEILPGHSYLVPPYTSSWVISKSNNHRFTAVFITVPVDYPPRAVPTVFPPTGPTGLTAVMYAYLYKEYEDDEDLQAFFRAYNGIQQDYVDTLNAINLPIYTNRLISGALCDWVLRGIYGYRRPSLFVKKTVPIGPFNTVFLNRSYLPVNGLHFAQPFGVVVADDDIYKRCVTWHVQKGDGRYFNVRWLKRRVQRFCYGADGTSPHIDNTSQISVGFGPNYDVVIRFVMIVRKITGGAILNAFGPNSTGIGTPFSTNISGPNIITTTYVRLPPLPKMEEFREAVSTGALELPFQFTYSVAIG
jgi:hypothetical protein